MTCCPKANDIFTPAGAMSKKFVKNEVDLANLVPEHLRAIRTDISEIKLKVDELTGSYAGLLKIAASQGDAIVRLDRRVERIEKRLDLVEA